MQAKHSAILFLALAFFLAGCATKEPAGIVQPPSEKEILSMLSESQDFQDWNSDFVKSQGKEPILKLEKNFLLTEAKIKEMIEKAQIGQKEVVQEILSGFSTDSNSVYYVEMKCVEVPSKGIIAIIDVKEKKALKFYATLGLST